MNACRFSRVAYNSKERSRGREGGEKGEDLRCSKPYCIDRCGNNFVLAPKVCDEAPFVILGSLCFFHLNNIVTDKK